ncbi:MAG: heme exporter protein CcmB [Luteibaculaceae bacterium]
MKNWIKLLRLEFKLEYRNLSSTLSLLLYMVAAMYLINLSFSSVNEIAVYNAVFWLVALFAAFNTAAGSFNQYTEGYQLYLYTVVKPQEIFIGRFLFNAAVTLAINLTGLFLYNLFVGGIVFQEANQFGFILAVMLGSVAFAAALTFIAGISSKAGGNTGTLAILGFPVLLPVILINMRMSLKALQQFSLANFLPETITVLLLITLCFVLGYILFPYLWRE